MESNLYTPNVEGLTFEKVWLMFQETSIQAQETKLMFQETDRKFQETDRKFQETDKKIDRLAKLYGGVAENSKDVAEEFFFRGLESRNQIFGIEYEHIDSMSRHRGKLQGQFDIVLYNGDKMVVIEVKYKLHPNDVDDFHDRKLPNFRALYPEYNDRKIIGAVAALSIPTESVEKANAYGFLVLTQAGNDLSIVNQTDFEPKIY